MAGSISSISMVSGTGSSSGTSRTDLQAQLAARQQALAAAATAEERKAIQASIDALQTRIDAQSSAPAATARSGGPQGGPPGGGKPPAGGPPPPPPQGNVANVGTKNFDSTTPFGNRVMYV